VSNFKLNLHSIYAFAAKPFLIKYRREVFDAPIKLQYSAISF
jgi:hypothetical protein